MRNAGLFFLTMILAAEAVESAQVLCRLTPEKVSVCAQASILVTLRCRNESPIPVEWLDPGDRRAVWEVIRPDGSAEEACRSRYSLAANLISLPPNQETVITGPLTRWFALTDIGLHRIRFQLADASASSQLETNEINVMVRSCSDADVLAACRNFLGRRSPIDLEAVAGFDSEAAVPCMEEALARGGGSSVSIIDGLARIHSAEAIGILVRHFHEGDAFDRLAIWQALHSLDISAFGEELREKVREVLSKEPVSLK